MIHRLPPTMMQIRKAAKASASRFVARRPLEIDMQEEAEMDDHLDHRRDGDAPRSLARRQAA